jgi:hypothetical protein
MRHLLTTIIIFIAGLSIGQAFKYPEIIKASASISGFVPVDWTIRDSIFGIIDHKEVYVIVLQPHDTVTLKNKAIKSGLQKVFPRVLVVTVRDSVSRAY